MHDLHLASRQHGTSDRMKYDDYDCTKLDGRLRSICEGTSGLPDTGEGHTREAYVKMWKAYPETATTMGVGGPAQCWRWLGLGNVLAFWIRVATLGLLKPWPGCHCESRRATLNRWGLWLPRCWPGRRKAP